MSTLAATPVVPLYAGFWRRGAALFLDSLVLLVPNLAVTALMPDKLQALAAELAIGVAYFTVMHASARQATLGKMAFGIKVTDHAGRRIGLGRSAGRYFATWLSVLTLCVGYLLAAFTARREALHDMIAGTYVVNEDASPENVVAGGDTMPVTAGVWIVIVVFFLLPFLGGIGAAIAIPAYQDYLTRAKMSEVFVAAESVKRQVEESYAAKQPLPAGPVEISTTHAKGATVTATGNVVVDLADPFVRGGRVVFAPRMTGAGIQGWDCHGENVPPKFLPRSCRE